MSYESRGFADADNPRSSAAGLFQFIRKTWDGVAAKTGTGDYASGAPYRPCANVRNAAWLATNSGWHHWPRFSCR
jgi:hypothetical protein